MMIRSICTILDQLSLVFVGKARVAFDQWDLTSIAEAAYLEFTGADYAMHNRGGTRNSLDQGPFTYREIWNIFPFDNTLVITERLGKDIPEPFDGHEPIDPNKMYKIVTNSYVRDQVQRYFSNMNDVEWTDTGIALRDAILRYIEKHKTIDKVELVR